MLSHHFSIFWRAILISNVFYYKCDKKPKDYKSDESFKNEEL